MKRWIIYAAVLAMLGFSPLRRIDIGNLSPVRTVWITEAQGQVYLQTDAGNFGAGANMEEAIEDLNASAPKTVFLETADYLIVEKGKEKILEQTTGVFHPTCMICVSEKMPDLEGATEFLSTHEPKLTLQKWRIEQVSLQQLYEQDGRFRWEGG